MRFLPAISIQNKHVETFNKYSYTIRKIVLSEFSRLHVMMASDYDANIRFSGKSKMAHNGGFVRSPNSGIVGLLVSREILLVSAWHGVKKVGA